LAYEITIRRSAQAQLDRLVDPLYTRVADAIEELADEPRPPNCVKLSQRPGWRVRVGDIRVVYGIDDDAQVVEILAVAHRRDVYR
jgi:mRNA interferase RelE/StbE